MKLLAARVCAFVLGAAASLGVAAADLDAGVRAYRARDFDAAVAQLQPLAELGDPDAAFYLGSIHARDDSRHQDDYMAYKLLSRAARAGRVDASDALILMRAKGKVSLMFEGYALRPADKAGLEPLRQAALEGRFDTLGTENLTRLAVAYCEHMGLAEGSGPQRTVDRNENVHDWLQRAAEAGEPRAQFLLGMLYAGGQPCHGVSVKIDRALGLSWWRKAAAQGLLQAQRTIAAFVVRAREGIPADPKEGMEWLRQAAARDDAPAMAWLGIYHDKGYGVPRDAAQAMRWFRKAADLDDVTALDNLGDMLSAGQDVPADPVEAHALYRRAADLGDPYAQRRLAEIYTQGAGVEKSAERALQWRTASARGGDPVSQTILGQMYLFGRDAPRDPKAALDWLREGASRGQPQGLLLLGSVLEAAPDGLAKAWALYTLSDRAGEPRAAPRRNTIQARMSADELARGERLAADWRLDARQPGDWNWRALSLTATSPEDSF
ncbi:hypothetical protein SAMN05443579_1129 [Variovorax sp. PDC80]|uniref:SEL1-like repeat protein n=1 Tax=Variovorax sp. PDC80 TaxID=1882827 RepID=UPI0008E13D6A|nr:SEL1-like repeat protein [Variovorax sp. PDC80]SFP51393.1 hypothetical protein SAMN05443579_1129 [Variovorax sp. PDC80]